MELYTHSPQETPVICADELGPVIPPLVPTAARLEPDGHRIKAPMDYSADRRRPGSTAACGSATCWLNLQDGWWRI
ncbi:hypothetical protein [Micromonospora sp. NPDC023814]|uniref:hypothetical protein n=1 Tax=Micromonospora sp. NPDC023814 TaxID=3154596 RepID=UPI0033F7F1C9